MGRIDELASAEFARWEQRGRGWQVWPEPVRPEPPFEEFTGYRLAQTEAETVDDGRKPGFLATFFDSLERKLNPPPLVESGDAYEPEPVASEEPLTIEFAAFLPAKLEVRDEALCALLDSLQGCAEPTAFELLATQGGIHVQFAASATDAPALQRQLAAFLPTLSFSQSRDALPSAWHGNEGVGFIVEFGLAHEAMLPLETSHTVDPFVGLVAVLNELREGEVAVFQVLFQGVRHPWPGSVWRSVTDAGGKALFVNRPQLITGTKAKLETPLFGVVVRAAAKAETFECSVEVLRDMATTLRTFSRHEGNRLIPLTNEEYDFAEHEADLTSRQSRRGGMLLNRDELLGFVHLPADEVQASKLVRQRFPTKTAPAIALSPTGLLLGHNIHAGRTTPVRLTKDLRTRHMHVIGQSGSGKSTFLFNLIQQDILAGEGVGVIDPQGELIEKILGAIPPERIKDVVLVDPSDDWGAVGLNILAVHGDTDKTQLASELMSIFERFSTSWGDQMDGVLHNAILAVLDSTQGGTLSDLRRFLLEPKFREQFLETVQDPSVRYYWRKGFAQLSGSKSVGPVFTRLEKLLSPKPVSRMLWQAGNQLDFADIMDSGKIFLAKISGIGSKYSHLLGSLFMAKFLHTAMAREKQAMADRRHFWLYCDEFQNYVTPTIAEILSGMRKYRLGLTLAHHDLTQMECDRAVTSAVLTHPCTRVVFQVGEDGRKLESRFTSFTGSDMQNLGVGEALVRVQRNDCDFNLSVSPAEEIDPVVAAARLAEVTQASRRAYSTPLAEIEAYQRLHLFPDEPERPKPAAMRKAAEPTAVPQAAEVPKRAETVPVAELPKPSVSPAATEPKAPADLGRGGAQHKAIQKRLKEAAEKLGYLATTEKSVLENSGSVDLALESAQRTIAVEITVTTTIDHEVGNVTKCLRAGFQTVAVVSSGETKLKQMRDAVGGALEPELAARVGYYTPDQFLAHLASLTKEDANAAVSPPKETTVRGYKVTRSAPKLTPEEYRAKEAAAHQMLAASMKEKPRDKRG